MIQKLLACLLAAALTACLFLPACAEEEKEDEPWICLVCGSESTGKTCESCSVLKGIWPCAGCGRNNIRTVCGGCGLSRDESVEKQALSGIRQIR